MHIARHSVWLMKKSSKNKLSERNLERDIRQLIDTLSDSGKMTVVPSKRKKGKEFIGGYVSNELKRQFKKVARKETRGDAKRMLVKLVIEGLARRGVKIDAEGE